MHDLNNLSTLVTYVNDNGGVFTFTLAGGALLTSVTGFDAVSVDLTEEAGMDNVGTVVLSSSVQSRPVTLSGVIAGELQTQSKERLQRVFLPGLSGRLYAGDWYLTVIPVSTPAIERKRRYASFQVQLLAPYPYWVSAQPSVFEFSAGAVSVYNPSPVPVPYSLTLTVSGGTLKNPILRYINDNPEQLSKPFLKISDTLLDGFGGVFASTHSDVHYSYWFDGFSACGEADYNITVDSTLIRIPPGSTELYLGAESGKDYLSAVLEFAEEKTGVIL